MDAQRSHLNRDSDDTRQVQILSPRLLARKALTSGNPRIGALLMARHCHEIATTSRAESFITTTITSLRLVDESYPRGRDASRIARGLATDYWLRQFAVVLSAPVIRTTEGHAGSQRAGVAMTNALRQSRVNRDIAGHDVTNGVITADHLHDRRWDEPHAGLL